MPPWKAALNDEAIAGVLTFVRRSWGHDADPVPVGSAFAEYYKQVGTLFNQQSNALAALGRFEPGAEQKALRCRLGALDRRSLVIHGDPAVAFPALGGK